MKKDMELILENGSFDLLIENGDFKAEDGLDTALWVSLFTDARADESQVLQPESRRGWMGNLVSNVFERQLGGLLWLAEQRRLIQETLNEVEDYVRKSLDWMLEDGLARNIEVSGEIVPLNGLAVTITITTQEGSTDSHYVPLWEVTGE